MALDLQTAKNRLSELITSAHASRLAYEIKCGLWFLYAYANDQWAHEGSGAATQSIQQLRPIVNPSDPNIRLSLQQIRDKVLLMDSRLRPMKLEYETDGATHAANDRIAAQVGKRRLDLYGGDQGERPGRILKLLRRATKWRTVLGSIIVRRQIIPRGTPVTLRNPVGEPMSRADGSERYLQRYGHHLSIVPPYELIRDPAANSPDFDGENCIAHEKPVPVDDLARRYGKRIAKRIEQFKKTHAKMGDFYRMQGFVYRCTGSTMGVHVGDSRAKAVLIGDAWFRDAETGWPYHMLYARDVAPESDEAGALDIEPLQFGVNPYESLPLHHYVYDEAAGHMWGLGIPMQGRRHQDMYNLAATNLLRVLMFQSGSPWVVHQRAFDTAAADLLSFRATTPLVVNAGWVSKHGEKPIERLSTSQVDPNMHLALEMSRQGMDTALGIQAVHRGQGPARGEAGIATQMKLEQADAPIEDRVRDAEIVTNELLTGTLGDLRKIDDPKSLRAMFGGEFGDAEIGHYLRQDSNAVIGVRVKTDSLRPMTRRERREASLADAGAGILDAQAVRYSRMIHGEPVDPTEFKNLQFQQTELTLLRAGQPAPVEEDHVHWVHLRVCQDAVGDAAWLTYPEKMKAAIRAHAEEHRAYLETESAIAAEPGAPQPQPEQPGMMQMGMQMPGEQFDMTGVGGPSPGVIPFPQQAMAGPPSQGGLAMPVGAPNAGQAMAM